MKMYKLIFLNSMILGTLISISSYSWFSMWMGLEINLLSMIPLFTSSNNILSSESSLKYFITQAMASLIMLMAVIMLLMTNEFITPQMNSHFMMMLNSALLMKMGAAPFHFWFPEVIEGLSWINSMILLTWQKIAPMMLMMNTEIKMTMIIIVIILCLTISTISGFNQISLRKILAYSSINHIAWMLSSLMISFSLWTTYFTVYSLINFNMIMILKSTKTIFINQAINIMNQNKLIKFTFMMNFLSLGGLPPFIGFLPKWLVINWMTENNFSVMALIMITTTLIMLFIYTRTMMPSILLSTTETKVKKINASKFPILMTNTITLTSLFLCTMLFNCG